jgi:hypothetical protein
LNRTLVLKETSNSTKQPKKKRILQRDLNLQTMSTARRRCRSSLSRPGVVGCGQEVDKRVEKITPVSEMEKSDELSMKLS